MVSSRYLSHTCPDADLVDLGDDRQGDDLVDGKVAYGPDAGSRIKGAIPGV